MENYTHVHIHYTGRGIGKQSVTGTARIIRADSDWLDLPKDPIIIVTATTPAMLPYLSKVRGIIAEQPGLTSHAALVSRELDIPAIVSAANATHYIQNGLTITIDSASGEITVGRAVEQSP